MTPQDIIKEFEEKYISVWSSKYSEFIRIPDGIKGDMVKQVVSTIISVLKEQVEVADVMMKNEKGSLKLNYANGKEYWVEVGSDRMFFYNEALSDYKHDIKIKIKEWEALLDK